MGPDVVVILRKEGFSRSREEGAYIAPIRPSRISGTYSSIIGKFWGLVWKTIIKIQNVALNHKISLIM